MMDFYFPAEFGEQLAFGAAAFSAFLGLVMMFMPTTVLKFFRLATIDGGHEGNIVARSGLAGLYLGGGLPALLLAQPMVYMAFGMSMALSVFGGLLSILSDQGATLRNCLLMVVNLALAVLPLLYVFGMV